MPIFPEASIVIPAHVRDEQGMTWLFQAIQSVRHSSMANQVEIILVDDGSPIPIPADESVYRLVRLDRNRGPGAARNTGIHVAKGHWIIPLDSDDLMNPLGIETLYKARCERGIIYGDLEYIDGRVGIHRLEEFGLFHLQRFSGPMPVTCIYSKPSFIEAGGYDEGLEGLEDIDFVIRAAMKGICGKHVDGVIFKYRIHAGSRQTDLQDNGRQKLNLLHAKLIERHRSSWSKIEMARCDKCPGGTGPGPGLEISMTDGIGPDAISVKYVGPKLASFFEHGMQTHVRYQIPGKGGWFKVDPRDVDGFLLFRDGGGQVYIVDGPPDPTFSVAHMPMPEIEEVPDISTLTLAAAKSMVAASTDVLDLRVWMAEEKSSDKPRASLVSLIASKMKELGDE